MKFLRRIMLVLMAGVMFLGAFGCGSSTDDSGLSDAEKADMTEIRIMNFGGGLGRSFIDESIKDFMELKKTESYEEGKTGVYFTIENSTNTGSATMSGSGYNIYFDVPSKPVKAYIADGSLLDITDIMDDVIETVDGKDITLNDKLDQSMMFDFKGDGADKDKVFALPNYEFFGGLSYDRTAFIKDNLYFA